MVTVLVHMPATQMAAERQLDEPCGGQKWNVFHKSVDVRFGARVAAFGPTHNWRCGVQKQTQCC